ncbi:endo-1,4-beta-xylanase [Pedobacter sp. HMWF019]|uniref:alpha/beta hydrolase n=1 Tax=Pedobacter sp. HMWF019 TaxID=2056856 RepID=UPI000D36BBAF|nr:alpha/beta hydrolase [Pedobacter sp. HMWF019]PTS95404.1 endo-1,4-beta-xylanase [Pedobacter sp. HMWF019]
MKILISMLFLMVGYTAVAQLVLPLYPDTIPGSTVKLSKEDAPTLTLYLPIKEKATGTAVLVIPGGAYGFLAFEEEGIAIGKAFAEKGIAAFVLKYRLPKKETMRDKSYGPLMDAQQAMKVIRSNAVNWNVNPAKVGVIGYSAGGHLASTLGTHFTKSYIPNKDNIGLRPDFMILVYPVISMDDQLTHMGSKINLLGIEPSKEKVDLFSNELQVTKETPPTYLTHCGDDQVVDVNNSIVFYQALQKNGVDAELHLFPKGNHGFTQRLPVSEWLDPMLGFLKREGFYK